MDLLLGNCVISYQIKRHGLMEYLFTFVPEFIITGNVTATITQKSTQNYKKTTSQNSTIIHKA